MIQGNKLPHVKNSCAYQQEAMRLAQRVILTSTDRTPTRLCSTTQPIQTSEAMGRNKSDYQKLAADPRIRALLNTVRYAEGTDSNRLPNTVAVVSLTVLKSTRILL